MKPMNKTLLALLVSAVSMGAYAEGDEVKTKGGFQIKSEDGLFEAKIGGRIHLDANYFTQEEDLKANAQDANSTIFLRRAYLTLTGRAYDFDYKFENDFAAQTGSQNSGFREMWIGRKVEGHNVRVGQAKPYRGMEELTSSNEITFMERPFATNAGIYEGRQFQTGVFVDNVIDNVGYGVSVYNVRALDAAQNSEGRGYNGRVYYVPIQSEGDILHLGASFSKEDTPEVASASSAGGVTLNGNNAENPRLAGRNNGLRGKVLDGATHQQVMAAEFAFRTGQFYIQSEFARNKADAANAVAGKTTTTVDNTNCTANCPVKSVTSADTVVDQGEQTVDTYYVQTSYMLTDHYKPYDFKKGVFKSPKISGGEGAIELRARYDVIENKDYILSSSVRGVKGTQYTLGATYFATPNSRFMLEYVDGRYEQTGKADQHAALVQARAQFNF